MRALWALVPVAAAVLAAAAPVAMPQGFVLPANPYGRWTVSEKHPVFTARGRLYKTIDVAPCGRGFCAVSVGDDGKCGVLLARFPKLTEQWLDGAYTRGKWGNGKQDIYLYDNSDSEKPNYRSIGVSLGDGVDFGSRSGNMPKFDATYRRLGNARCVVR
jgi:hypothetical protein